jgi:hypothetical protein
LVIFHDVLVSRVMMLIWSGLIREWLFLSWESVLEGKKTFPLRKKTFPRLARTFRQRRRTFRTRAGTFRGCRRTFPNLRQPFRSPAGTFPPSKETFPEGKKTFPRGKKSFRVRIGRFQGGAELLPDSQGFVTRRRTKRLPAGLAGIAVVMRSVAP